MYKLKIIYILILIGNVFSQEYNELDFICDYDGNGKRDDCDLFYSFAQNSLATNDYQGAIDQYNTILICNCGKGEESTVYEKLGRAYAKVGKIDSCTWAYKQGLQKDPDDKVLLESAAWSTGQEIRKGNNSSEKVEEQLYFLDRLLELDPEDVVTLERMSEVYRKSERFEEQIVVLEKWIQFDPDSKKAISNLKAAYETLGKDASEVDRERWEKEPSNVEYGISYLKSLISDEEFSQAIEVGEELLLYDDKDKRLLQLISDAYIKDLDDQKAAKYLEKLLQIDSKNFDYIIKISNVYINLEQFEKAYNWANKAISTNKKVGKAYFQRAEVLSQMVDVYRSDELDFCDRLVYDLASEDYDKAYKNGVLNAKIYKNNLNELITSVGDWFLAGEKLTQLSPGDDKCSEVKGSNVFNFLSNRKVQKK